MHLQTYFIWQDEVLIIRLEGELDHHEAASLKENWQAMLRDHQAVDVILNLEKVTFMDSSGIGVILGRYKEITARGGELVICALNPAIERLLQLSGLFKIIRYEAEEAHALYSLGGVR